MFHAPVVFIGEAFKGAAAVDLLQSLDNEANGHLRERPKGVIFSALFSRRPKHKWHPKHRCRLLALCPDIMDFIKIS
jgi:hypothetical protein